MIERHRRRERERLFGLSNIFISVSYSDWREEKHSTLKERELHKRESDV